MQDLQVTSLEVDLLFYFNMTVMKNRIKSVMVSEGLENIEESV